MFCEFQAIVTEARARLSSFCKLQIKDVVEVDTPEALSPSEGRRILVGLCNGESAMLIFTYSEGVCREIVHQFGAGEDIDHAENDINEALLEVSALITTQARAALKSKGITLSMTPPVVIVRSNAAITTATGVRCESARINTRHGEVTLTMVMRAIRVETVKTARDIQVLVVEDDPFAQRLLAKFLADMQFSVEVADSGEDAIATFERQPADLVMLDYNMPGMNGLQCLKQIKRLPSAPAVIMVTAVGEPETVRNCLALGADGYVVKPYQLSVLRQQIAKVFEPLYTSRA